jgi:PAS domain S-box-containing protein
MSQDPVECPAACGAPDRATERAGRTLVEEAEAAAAERCRLQMERSAAGMFRADLNGCILAANGVMARILGLEAPGDMIGRRTADFYWSPELGGRLREALGGQAQISGMEMQLKREDGAPIWVLANLNLAEGETSVVEGSLIDITDRKRAQDRTVQVHRLYSVAIHLNQAIVRISGRDALLDEVCRIAIEDGGFRVAWIGLVDQATGLMRRAAHRGVEPAEGALQDGPALPPASRGGDFVVNDVTAGATAGPYGEDAGALGCRSYAVLPLTVDGEVAGTLNLYAAEPGFFDEQNMELLHQMAEDVAFALENMAREADRRRSEQERARIYLSEQAALAQARADAWYRELLEAAPDAILESDAEGRILVANAAAEKLFGLTRDELLASRVEDLVPEELRATYIEQRNAFFTDPQSGAPGYSRDFAARRKDGAAIPVEISLGPVRTGRGRSVTCIVRDATARKRAEAALHESNRRIGSILESITDAFFALDRDWRYTYINGKAEQLLGRKREDLQGRSLWAEFPGLVGTVFEHEYRRAADEQRPVEFSAFDIERKLWADVHVYPSEHGLSIYLQDITARKLLEEQSGQSQRLEALGRLAGGIAHDFNNLLTIIGGYGQMLVDAMDGRNPLRKDVEPIVEAANRASALTRQLLAFSRRQVMQPKVVDLNRLITKMNKMLRRVIGEDIELKLALRSDLGRTKADAGQIEQVLMNLAINARDAMPKGGSLSITTDNYQAAADQDPAGLPPGDYVSLTFSDTGTGMDEYTRTHVFEPFFTTKERGKGTGLGLATAYGIVTQAGGEIRVESAPDKGACFRIYLPRTRKAPKVHQEGDAHRRPRKGTETILLVEDEPEVRKLTREMLTRLGYRVLEAANAAEALDVWSASQDSIDLLLTDIIMPHMSGTELAGELSAGRPGLKILYISGYTDEMIARHGVMQNNAALLEKPFTREALGLKVRSILDAGPGAATA